MGKRANAYEVWFSIVCGLISGLMVWVLDVLLFESAIPTPWIVAASAVCVFLMIFLIGRSGRSESDGSYQVLDKSRYYELYYGLPECERRRYDALREHIGGLRVRPSDVHVDDAAWAEQVADVDAILWIYLCVLVSRAAVLEILNPHDAAEVESSIELALRRLARLPDRGGTPYQRAKRRTIQAQLTTAAKRKHAISQARQKCDWMTCEIERIETELVSLSARNGRDPDQLSQQVKATLYQSQSTFEQLAA